MIYYSTNTDWIIVHTDVSLMIKLFDGIITDYVLVDLNNCNRITIQILVNISAQCQHNNAEVNRVIAKHMHESFVCSLKTLRLMNTDTPRFIRVINCCKTKNRYAYIRRDNKCAIVYVYATNNRQLVYKVVYDYRDHLAITYPENSPELRSTCDYQMFIWAAGQCDKSPYIKIRNVPFRQEAVKIARPIAFSDIDILFFAAKKLNIACDLTHNERHRHYYYRKILRR